MKKTIIVWLLAAGSLCCCTTEKALDPASKLKFKVEIVGLSASNGAEVPTIAWVENDAIAIKPIAAKTDGGDLSTVRFVAGGNGSSAFFNSTSSDFYPDESISRHSFAVAYPFVSDVAADGSNLACAARQSVKASGLIEKSNIPFFGIAEINTPAAGSTVSVRISPLAAVVGIPVPAAFGPVSTITLKSEGKLVVKLDAKSDSKGSDRYFYAAVAPSVYTSLTAEMEFSGEGPQTISLEDIDAKAGKFYNLTGRTVAKNQVYSIDLAGIAFDKSYIYDALDETGNVVAIICKEYLDTVANQQAVTVYGTKTGTNRRVMDASDPVCLVANVLLSAPESQYSGYTAAEGNIHGGIFSFNADKTGYVTPGTGAALSTAYAELNGETGTSGIVASTTAPTVAATIVPRTLDFSDRADTTKYKLVKIGRQIWMAENLNITKFNDGTDIRKVTSGELYGTEGAACVNTASTTLRMMYNIAAVRDGKFLPENSPWKVPTGSDIKTFVSRIPQSGMISKFEGAENITLFGVAYAGRVTNKSWSSTKSLDPCFWSQSASTTSGQETTHSQCLVVRVDPSAAPEGNKGQNNHFGFFVRLVRGLY